MAEKPVRLAKLTRPRLHSALRRERLFRLLDKRVSRPVVWVSGPPGAGKTSLVASYLEARRLPGAWFQVDEGDLDPATFFYYLNTLARSIAPRKRLALPYLTPEYLGNLPGFARRYFRSFFGLFAEQAVLVLDNCQDAASETFHQILREACAELPEAVSLVLVSRTALPDELLRAKAEGKVLAIGRDELRLAPKEAEAIAAAAGRPDTDARALNERVGGWAAGLVLLLAKPGRDATAAGAGASHEELFGYFAGEILSRAKPELKAMLLKTSVVPELSVAVAKALSGDAEAGKRLEWLYRRQYFTERRAEGEVAYRYHDLFREFLERRFSEEYGDDEQHAVRREAGRLLLEKGQVTEAVELFRKACDWEALADAVREHARALFDAGRWRTLLDWLVGVPQAVKDGQPWLAFWEACARGRAGDSDAPARLEACYEAFALRGDPVGQFAVARTARDVAIVRGAGLNAVHRWSKDLVALLPAVENLVPRGDVLHAWRTITYSYAMCEPGHELAQRGLEVLTTALFTESLPDHDAVFTASIVAACCGLSADMALFDRTFERVRPAVSGGRVGPVALLMWHFFRFYVLVCDGRFGEAEEEVQLAQRCTENYPLGIIGSYAVYVRQAICRFTNRLDESEVHLARFESYAAPDRHWVNFTIALERAALFLRRGAPQRVVAQIGQIERAVEATGMPRAVPYVFLYIAEALAEVGRLAEAKQILDRECVLADSVPVHHSKAMMLGTLAHWHLCSGDEPGAVETFARALREAELPGRRGLLTTVGRLNQLCALALRDGVETDRVRAFIRLHRLDPPDPSTPHWPYPVSLRILGRRRISVGDAPLATGRKTPRLLLSFLDLLVCRGSSGVSRQQATDALWESADADAAEESLKVATRRLRVLLGYPDAVEVHQGRIRLSPKHVWADAWAFEALLARAKADGDPKARKAALDLYEGELLEGEADFPEAIAARERLRGLFVENADVHGRWLESQGCNEEALALYERGTQAEGLSEVLYCGQMRCLKRLNRADEARAVFRRLSQTLRAALNAGPSKTTLELYERISTE